MKIRVHLFLYLGIRKFDSTCIKIAENKMSALQEILDKVNIFIIKM